MCKIETKVIEYSEITGSLSLNFIKRREYEQMSHCMNGGFNLAT